MLSRKQLILILIQFVMSSPVVSFLIPRHIHSTTKSLPRLRTGNEPHNLQIFHRRMIELRDTNLSQGSKESSTTETAALVGLIATVSSWCVIAFQGLMYHPKLTLCLRHNLFTIAHALAFPLPILVASFLALTQTSSTADLLEYRVQRRIVLGIAVVSLWTGAAVFWGPAFSVGYNLFSNPVRYGCASIHLATAVWAVGKWKRLGASGNYVANIASGCVGSFFSLLSSFPFTQKEPTSDDKSTKDEISLYALSSLGLFLLAALPQLVSFPTATVPTLLGKRLSRAASGFTFLGAILAHCLQDAMELGQKFPMMTTLRRGLSIGAIGHLGLVMAKIIGMDGGGLLLPGTGLWEFYPSLVKSSPAAILLMFVTYSVLAYVSTREESPETALNE